MGYHFLLRETAGKRHRLGKVMQDCIQESITLSYTFLFSVVQGKESIAFSNNCGYSSLMQYLNPISSPFLKVCCNVGFENTSGNFSYKVTLKLLYAFLLFLNFY